VTDLARVQHPRVVFLDVGGPIYDDNNFVVAVRRALDEMRAARGLAPVPAAGFAAIYDAMRDQQAGSIRTELAERFLGGASDRGELSLRTKEYWTHPEGTLMPDAIPFLEAISGKAVVALVANQEAGVVDDLTRDGVAPFVDIWGISAIVGLEKPSPELFEWALAEAGVPASEAVHIGNRLDTDVRPARAVGLGTVWVVRGEAPVHPTAEQRAEPDLTVDSLVGLAELLFP
jgi:FMN phosphatase YigB (HAD superfamily)